MLSETFSTRGIPSSEEAIGACAIAASFNGSGGSCKSSFWNSTAAFSTTSADVVFSCVATKFSDAFSTWSVFCIIFSNLDRPLASAAALAFKTIFSNLESSGFTISSFLVSNLVFES